MTKRKDPSEMNLPPLSQNTSRNAHEIQRAKTAIGLSVRESILKLGSKATREIFEQSFYTACEAMKEHYAGCIDHDA